jgi:DUF3037 family protein
VSEKHKLEYFLLRYVPNAVREEFVNIGLVMTESGASGGGFADVRFTRDWRRLLCLDPQADIEMLRAMEQDVRRQVVEVRDCEKVMERLNDSFSNLIVLSNAKGCLTENPSDEIEKMAGLYLEPIRAPGQHVTSGRQAILEKMRDAWGQAGLMKLLQSIPAARYTKTGDPFAFDFGYRLGEELKLFHAVSLKANVQAAVTLGARYPRIADGMRTAKESLVPRLTAVVDDGLDQNESEIGFALGMMQENGITVRAVAEMAEIAEAARMELQV